MPLRKMTNHSNASAETVPQWSGSYKINPMTSGGPDQKVGSKLRSACDHCHAAKVKCSGGPSCARCRIQDLPCVFSYACRAGKPKGSKNKNTLERHARIRERYGARLSIGSYPESSTDGAGLPAQMDIASPWITHGAMPLPGAPAEMENDLSFLQINDVSEATYLRRRPGEEQKVSLISRAGTNGL